MASFIQILCNVKVKYYIFLALGSLFVTTGAKILLVKNNKRKKHFLDFFPLET